MERFKGLKDRCAGLFGSPAIWEEIRRAYGSPRRHYHGLEHLEQLFAALDPHLEGSPQRAAIELAVFLHDFHYSVDPGEYPLNEERSAHALRRIRERMPEADRRRMEENGSFALAEKMILATKGHRAEEASLEGEERNACELFLDADLSILAESEEAVDAYDEGIAREFGFDHGSPDLEFARKRGEALRAFKDRGRVFRTEAFAEKEEAAKRSLDRLIARWEKAAEPGRGSAFSPGPRSVR